MAFLAFLMRHKIPNVLPVGLRYMSNEPPAHCKVAIITGGSVGIGPAFTESFLQCGAKGVMLGDIQESKGLETACELSKKYGKNKVSFMKCDVTKPEEMENLFKCTLEKYKQLDFVCNNAGLLQDKFWRLEIGVNVTALVHGTLLGFKYMGKHKKGRGGSIINVASIYGLQQAFACPIYNGTKAFVVRFSDAMAHPFYYNMTGVKVFTICPGVTDTTMISKSADYALEDFEGLGKEVAQGLANLPPQPPSACGKCLIEILCHDENGSIWVIENSECYKIRLPDRHTLRVCD